MADIDWKARALRAEAKNREYKRQLKGLTQTHRIVKRQWLDWNHAASVAMGKYRRAQKSGESIGRHELALALQDSIARHAMLQRAVTAAACERAAAQKRAANTSTPSQT